MSKEIESLEAFGDRVIIGGEGFALLPYTVRVQARINEFFSTDDRPNGHDWAFERAFKQADMKVAVEVLYFFLKDSSKFSDVNSWREFVFDKVDNIATVYEILFNLINKNKADYSFEDKKKVSRKMVLVGVITLLLATVGTIHLLTLLYTLIYPFLNSLI